MSRQFQQQLWIPALAQLAERRTVDAIEFLRSLVRLRQAGSFFELYKKGEDNSIEERLFLTKKRKHTINKTILLVERRKEFRTQRRAYLVYQRSIVVQLVTYKPFTFVPRVRFPAMELFVNLTRREKSSEEGIFFIQRRREEKKKRRKEEEKKRRKEMNK